MLLSGIGNGSDSPISTPQEAAERKISLLIDQFEKQFAKAVRPGKRSVPAVHQMRVATRKIQSALTLYQDFLPLAETSWLRNKLKKVRRHAGTVRDLDVLTIRVLGYDPEHEKSQAQLQHAIQLMCGERSTILKPLQRKFTKLVQGGKLNKHKSRLLDGLNPSLQSPGNSSPFDSTTSHSVVHHRLRRVVQRFLRAGKSAKESLRACHKFRLRTKELRYCLEVLEDQLPKEFLGQVLPVVSRLQKKLGDINDYAAAMQSMKKVAAQCHGKLKRSILKLKKIEQKKLHRANQRLDKIWNPDRACMLQMHFKALGG